MNSDTTNTPTNISTTNPNQPTQPNSWFNGGMNTFTGIPMMPMTGMNQMPMAGMNPMGAMNPMGTMAMGQMNPMGSMNPMGTMAMGQMNPMGMNPMGMGMGYGMAMPNPSMIDSMVQSMPITQSYSVPMWTQLTDQQIIFHTQEIMNNLSISNEFIKNSKNWILSNSLKVDLIISTIKGSIPEIDPPEKKLYLLYLLNDVLHFSKFSGNEDLIQKIYDILPYILLNSYYAFSEEHKKKITETIDLWNERQIFISDKALQLKQYLKNSPPKETCIVGYIISHMRNSTANNIDIHLPLKHEDINYNQLHQYDRSSHNHKLHDSITQFYQKINNYGPPPTQTTSTN
ncbi:hypothetical protein DLAC_08296 [Tieghemostelium lacteum]|uniref:CID domain-containing protein n=1 Tax=Tieghemostelium lacteum TaxID=361077 RepID=A0A151ZBM0_TIELA|nr:hypothetical protein DLAC_08296 [Tieghemostelium lacteum]|eukprot:KYQ91347.1 hypothetical protein DLAC_08296 [Tieghemostelium lacteum]